MKAFKQSMKRCLALALAAVMLLSMADTGLITRVNAAQAATTVSYGTLIANSVEGLGTAEKNILKSGLLAGTPVTYQAPENSDNLISVDAENKKITVSPYTDAQGNGWTITACRVVYEGGQEDVTLTNGEGTFTYEGDAYAVEADYALTKTADGALTEKLLHTSYWLAKGVNNLKVLSSSDVQSTLQVLADNRNMLETLANGYTIPGTSWTVTFDGCKDNAQNLLNQLDANAGKLDLKVKAENCGAASSKTAYLVTDGSSMKESAAVTYTDLANILNVLNTNRGNIINTGVIDEAQLNTVCNSLQAWLNTVKPVVEDPWTILSNTDALKSGMTSADYASLDILVASAALTDFTGTVPTTLNVANATVECATNRYTVTVKVAAKVIDQTSVDSATTTDLPVGTTSFKLNGGATGTAILAQIAATNIEADTLSGWDPFYAVNETNYDRSVSLALDGSYTLDNDITYTITYTPKTMTVTYGEGCGDWTDTRASVPYGYQMTLPLYDGEQVYDYKVNENDADQGDVIRITGATTITRALGKAWENHDLGKLIVNNYAPTDTVAQSILANPALNTGTFRLRTPTDSDALVSMDSSTGSYVVTAKAYKANTGDLWWAPASGTLSGGAADGTPVTFTLTGERTYTATISGSSVFDQVQVNYQVALPWEVLGISEAEANTILNLPNTLTTEASSQKGAMDQMNGQYANIEMLNQNLNAIKVGVNGSELPQECKDAVADLVENGTDGTTLYLYTLLNGYRACGSNGEKLAYYFRNYSGVTGLKAQIDLICKDFKVLAVDNAEAFRAFLTEMNYGEYADKIETIYNSLVAVQSGMVAPNVTINVASTSLNDLAALIANNIGNTQAYTNALAAPTLTTQLSVDAPNKVSVTITVQVKNSDGAVIKSASQSISFPAEAGSFTLNADQAAQLNTLKATLVNGLLTSEADKQHYATVDSDRVFAEGEVISTANNTATIVYKPTTYTVHFVDGLTGNTIGDPVTFPFDNPTIALPACTDGENRYDYQIAGEWKSDASYTFSEAQIDTLFAGGSYTITRRTVNESREKIEELVAQLNQAIADGNYTFTKGGRNCLKACLIPVEKDGELSLVLRISPENTDNLQDALMKVVQALVNSSYQYVGIGSNPLKADDKFHLQGLLDAILNSGMGLSTIVGMIDANGNINEMTLDGTVVGVDGSDAIHVTGDTYINDASLYGGKMMETTLDLGSNSENAKQLPLYITMEDFDRSASALQSVRNGVVQVRQYVELTAAEGRLNLQIKLTDGQYAAVVTGMLATGQVTKDDLTDVDPVALVHYLYDIVKVVPEDEAITGTTLSNTLSKLGTSANLSVYDTIAPILRNLMNNGTVSNEQGAGDTYQASLNYDLSELIESLNLGSLAGVIAEKDSGLNAGIGMKVNNLGKSYTAMVVDTGASGLNILRYYNSAAELQSALNGLNGTSLVVLLDDCDGSLNISGQTVLLDLNGKTLAGSLTADSKTVILDSSANNEGKVTGAVSGTNLTITAGSYQTDVSELLPEGYTFDNGKVANDMYVWAEDASGNYTIILNADMLKMDKMPSVQSLALELVYDLALKHFTSASMAFDSNTIYDINLDDLVDLATGGTNAALANDLLACIDNVGITNFANDLLDVVTDFAAMSNAMANGGELKTYELKTGTWTIELERIANGNYLTANIVPTAAKESRNVTLKIQDNANGEFAALVDKIKDVAVINAEVNLDPITYANSSIHVNGGGSVDATFNLNRNSDYAAVVAVLLASQTSGEVKSNLITAVQSYSNTGRTGAMKDAIEAVKISELIAALKNLERDTFATLVSEFGLTGLSNVQDLEAVYDDFLVMVGNAASALNLTGGSRTIGSYAGSYGSYLLTGTYNANTEGRVNLTAQMSVRIQMNLLNPDSETSVVVMNNAGVQVYSGESLTDAFAAAASNGSTIYVYRNVQMQENVSVANQISIVGAAHIIPNGHSIGLSDAAAQITADMDLSAIIVSGVNGMEVHTENTINGYVHSLTEIILPDIEVIDSNGTRGYTDLAAAFADVEDGGTIQINASVTLNSNVTVAKSITIVGADKITWNSHTITLSSAAAQITADKNLGAVIQSGVSGKEVKIVASGSNYIHSLTDIAAPTPDIEVIDSNGTRAYTDLAAAFAAVAEGGTIKVNASVTLNSNVTVSKNITITGAAKINQNGKAILLAVGGSLKTDAALNVTTKEAYYKVVRSGDTYKLSALTPELKDEPVTIIPPTGGVIADYKVDTANSRILLDIDPENGITEAQLKSCVSASAINASQVTYSINGVVNGRVVNGATLRIVASNPATNVTDIKVYTIIIMGDTNCNGVTDSGDAVLMMKAYLNGTPLTGVVGIAADMNQNGELDSGDAVKNATKYTYLWANGEYQSAL